MRQLPKPELRKKKRSNYLCLLAVFGISFLLLNYVLLITWLPSSNESKQHSAHSKNTNPKSQKSSDLLASEVHKKNRNNNSQEDLSKEEFFKQFQDHPYPYHVIKNVTKYGITRIVAIGDLHGDFEQTIKILQMTGCINDKQEWIALNTILVQTGDIMDRGDNVIGIIRLFKSLHTQSVRYNSLVFNLLGNHETLELTNEYIYCDKKEMDKYGGTAEWKELLSAENEEIGLWLRQMSAVIVIDNSLFCHAGMRSMTLKNHNNDIDEINAYATDWLMSGDGEYQTYLTANGDEDERIRRQMIAHMNGPFWTRAFEPRLYLMEGYLMNELAVEYGLDAVKTAELEKADIKDKIFKELITNYMCKHLQETLDILGIKRMFKGHDPQWDGEVAIHCNRKMFIIDVGISKSYGSHNTAVQVNLLNDTVSIIGEGLFHILS